METTERDATRNFTIGKHILKHEEQLLQVDLSLIEGKLVGRMFAYLLWTQGEQGAAQKLFRIVGK